MPIKLSIPYLNLWVVSKKDQIVLPGDVMFSTSLKVKHIRDGLVINSRDLGAGMITLAGATAIAASSTLSSFTYHDTGSSTVSPNIAQTALLATAITSEIGGRATGTVITNANVYENVANIQYNAPLVVAEWGLFNATTSGTMLDRKTFTGISVIANDFLQFLYQLTVTPGG